MKFLPTNTLAHFNAAPQVHQHDHSDLPIAVLSAATKKYRVSCGTTFPNDDAVTFYTLNHSAAIIRKSFTQNETLPAWAQKIMQTYTDVTMAQGERLLHYILSITAREMRHLKTHGHPDGAFWTKIETAFGVEMRTFLDLLSSHGSEETAVQRYMKEPPQANVGAYLKALSYAFHKANGWSGNHESYGGPKWGLVTDAAVSMLTGVTSMEMLVDTGYTLAHNGGPIFNKGMMYLSYDSHFLTILDVQRAGQLLELVLGADTNGVKKTSEAIEAATLIKQHCPEEVNGYIDWKLVDSLRPDKHHNLHRYQKQIAAQKQPKAPVKTAPVYALVSGKKAKVTGTWTVFPHQVVTVLERVGS